MTKITGIYSHKYLYDNGRDNQAPPYKVHRFNQITDESGAPLPDNSFKDTKLMQKVSFVKGKKYEIELDGFVPVSIAFDGERYFKKNGNSIMYADKKGKETNLSYNSAMQEMGKAKRAYTIKEKKGK